MTGFERKWSLDGVENFRDYGGYAAAGGRRLKTGLLYRSAHQGTASAADLERIDGIGLATLVDLRRTGERTRMPSLRGPAFAATVIDNDIDDTEVDSFHTHLIESDQSVAAMQAYLVDYYTHAPFERRHIDLYTRYFRALAEVDGPVLIHCAAGKDRTGILAALTHRLVGVSEDDIVADYLLTNDRVRMARRVPLFAAWVKELTGRVPDEEAIFATMGVEAQYLHVAFDQIEAKYGSVEGYLELALGVDAAMKARIEARLLE